jgi:hypothetical protein
VGGIRWDVGKFVKHVEAIKLLTSSHLVGSLLFTISTMHGHMNIKINQVTSVFEVSKRTITRQIVRFADSAS